MTITHHFQVSLPETYLAYLWATYQRRDISGYRRAYFLAYIQAILQGLD